MVRSDFVRRNYVATLRAMRPWMILGGIANIAVVFSVASGLMYIAPLLSVGWWSLLGNRGSPLFAQTGETGTGWQVLTIVMPLVVLALIPILAYEEEVAFRRGSEERSRPRRLACQFVFGMAHLTMGVPIAFGLALTISGLYFERVYLTVVRPLIPEIEAVGADEPFAAQPYPDPPRGGGYDADAWNRHQEAFDHVADENFRRLQEWNTDLLDRLSAGRQKQEAMRGTAVAKAAAAHAVSNLLIVTAALAVLILS